MAILPGTRLGPYEILSAIGAGGMGEVYRARDTKLARDVAIKVLSANFVNDPERLSRFQREARMLAALNHPNIATIYGLEQSDGVTCLVMELVPGETLQQRVKRDGAIPIEEALKIAAQIAEALEAAHEKSIIHRDLKPANVKVTPEGKVKVLDFGLAKAFESDHGSEDMSNSPTLTHAATMQGMILGTAAYMSPEQARGKSVDKRTDLWAFGCVLYELLTGKQAFAGEDATEILAAVVKSEPDWSRLPAATPPTIRSLLKRCLQKDKALRLRDAGDARIEILEALSAPATASPELLSPPKGKGALGGRELLLGLAALLAVAAAASLATWFLKPSISLPPQPVSRVTIALPKGQELAGLDAAPAIALSRDGLHLAYVARQGGPQQIYLRALDSLEAKPIPGTEGAVDPFFSPDGQWLGFFADGKVKKVSVSGGTAVLVGEGASPNGASWGNRGTIAFSPTNVAPILQMPDSGGAATLLSQFSRLENSHRWPEFLPDGKTVLFAAGFTAGNWTNVEISAQPPAQAERRNLVPGTAPRYASSGHLIFAQDGSLMAVAFDPRQLAVTGTAVPVVEGVQQSGVSGAAQYSISGTGLLAYISGGFQSAQNKLVWVNRNGTEQPLSTPAHNYVYPRLSPDGRRVALAIAEDQGAQVWLYDLQDRLTRLTFEGAANNVPAWTPDGKRIAFLSNKQSQTEGQNVFWQLADGSGGLERLTKSDFLDAPMSFSPDGQLLAYIESNPATGYDIWVVHISDRKAQPFIQTPFNESAPGFSPPDGRWLAYVSNESGRNEIYVQAYPGPGGKYQISTDGGTEPLWNRNGRELFYRDRNKMMGVDITTQPGFSSGKPHVLFEGLYLSTPATFPNYDVSLDGQRFLMLKSVVSSEAPLTQINLVLNWFEELKQKVPPGNK
jgi:eukaryotic-like serine/threonine-protein kinase